MRSCLIFIICLFSSVAVAENKDVLVVHSYHHGFFWTDHFQQGLTESLAGTDIAPRVLYLDTKRLQSEEYLNQLYRLFKTKFNEESYSAVVVSDNNALTLMQRLAPELGDTPIVFGGINNYQPEMHRGLRATGVTEEIDVAANLHLIERVQPQGKKIYIVTDHSTTGNVVRSQVDQFLAGHPKFNDKVEQIVPNSFAELIEFVKQLDAQSSVLMAVFYRDKQGWVTTARDLRRVTQVSGAPIYMAHNFGLGLGAVGGIMQNGRMHGHQVAQQLISVINNPNSPLPPVIAGAQEIKLDYQEVIGWQLGVEEELLAAFINKPEAFAQRYHDEIRTVGVVFFVLSLVIVSLIYYLSRLKKSEQIARDNQTMIEMVFDQSYHLIGILDNTGQLISTNNKLQNALYQDDAIRNMPIWEYRHWQKKTAERIERYFTNLTEDSVCQFEAEIYHREHGAMVLDLTLRVLPKHDNHIPHVLLEARDITSRKLTEERLFEREATLSYYYNQQPVMMITLDEQNRIQRVNSFAEQLLGYHEKELLGHRLKDFYVDENAIIPRQVLLQPNQALQGVWRREVEFRHRDGHSLWIRENIRPLVESGHLLIAGEDITEMRQLSEQLAYQAQYDLLTDTYNRNYFEMELDKALKEVESYTRTHAMLFLDMDQLKVLNDTAGHEAGDAAIQFCASMLQEVLPYNATLARMGGDEFAVLVKDCTERDAKSIADSIIMTLSEHQFIWNEIKLNLTCSIGIRLIDHTATSPQMVHAQADTACHAAKEEGRNRYNLYCPDDKELRRREMEMSCVNLVHRALADDRIELFAQRIMGLNVDDPRMHFEILVRIRNADNEYISPGIFMPASERYNIAHLLDKQVVSKTLSWLESHPEQLNNLALCAINLSGQSMGNQEFIRFLIETLRQSSVPCEKICLEITETAAMSNMNQALELFTQLKQLGCLIALDDFGSGLSSFGYLKKLPVDIVKIDGLFVRDIANNEMDHLMVRSINDLAKQMGKNTVAEFVENSQIIDLLMELGVDYAQGYMIGKPKPLAKLVDELMVETHAIDRSSVL
ncbi:EAL domain-containing protein [Vibrio panuliri]|uniref:Diguanylate cyclase n=1 Tax=Vibrio panuliri TaxID=1381081 RepID=A0ABX3F476_9VIBR|nr:EAL domain-containing protein [Vibrio panuliri]KAB1460377.1 EAL domain-containing protein [Vibrio panuliri]OLQ84107.1 diguanylate cyclase [Vibrio panuliri]